MVESNSDILYVSVGRVRDQTLLSTCKTVSIWPSPDTKDQDIRDHCMTLLCRQNNSMGGERSKSEFKGYAWHIYQDRNLICYILVTKKTFADEGATSFLRQLSATLYEKSPEFKKNPQNISTLQSEANHIILELQQNFGKTWKAQSTINSVTDVMRNNMSKFFSNQEDLEQMDIKSNNLKQSTETFASQSWRLE